MSLVVNGFKTSTFSLAGVGNATVEEGCSSKSSNQQGPAGGCQQPPGAGGAVLPAFRSRTDSVIEYTPPSVGEAAGSTFYINKNGNVDYVVLLKVSPLFKRGSINFYVLITGRLFLDIRSKTQGEKN